MIMTYIIHLPVARGNVPMTDNVKTGYFSSGYHQSSKISTATNELTDILC